MNKSVLWAEDLEGHRQPSLYYLDDEEGAADGPHLICDWNGAPTDVGEFDIDVLSLLKKHENEDENEDNDFLDASKECAAQQQQLRDEIASSDDFVDYPNPAANIMKRNKRIADGNVGVPLPTRQNDLIVEDCAHLDFLSVPPITSGLLKRIVRNLQRNQKPSAVNSIDMTPATQNQKYKSSTQEASTHHSLLK